MKRDVAVRIRLLSRELLRFAQKVVFSSEGNNEEKNVQEGQIQITQYVLIINDNAVQLITHLYYHTA